MGERRRHQAFSVPHGQLGVIGAIRITSAGGVMTRIEKYGVIASVSYAGSGVFNFTLSPPQPFYVITTGCTYVSNASFGQASFSAATITPNTFQIQGVGIVPLTGIMPPVLWVNVIGFVKYNARNGGRDQVGSTPHGPLDVIGMALWSNSTGAITNLRTYGCVKNVRFVATSQSDVDIWPAQPFYTICGMVSGDSTSSSFMAYTGTPTASKVSVQGIGVTPISGRNAAINCVTIFGFRKPGDESVMGLPKPRLGVLGVSRGPMSNTTVGREYTNYGIVNSCTGGGVGPNWLLSPGQISNYPAKKTNSQFPPYTCFGACSSDLAVTTFGEWNIGATTNNQYLTSFAPASNSGGGWAFRACQVGMLSIFGPLAS